jgi:HEAT repeat protein
MNLQAARANLSSKNPQDPLGSLTLLGESGTLADLPLVMSYLKHADIRAKATAVVAASTLIREKLIEHFQQLAPEMRQKLGSLLDSLDPTVVDAISTDIVSTDAERRVKAVQILGLLKQHPKIRNILARLIRDRDQKIRATAVSLLGKFTGANDLHIILSLLTDRDKRVRANTIEALESLGNPRVIPFLLRYRKDANNRIRGNAIKALYNLGQTDASESLEEMFESGDPFMAASALWVISRIKLSTLALEDHAGRCLLSDNRMVHDNACKALEAMNTSRSRGYLHYLG